MLKTLAFLAAIAPVFVGCRNAAPSTGFLVKGRVTFKGQPLSKGSLAFLGEDQSIYFASISPDGSYETNLPSGKFRVSVTSSPDMPEGMSAMEEFAYVSKSPSLPTRYGDFQTSPLTLSVSNSGDTLQDFLLKP
jgi:hypothetical protein